MPRSPRVLACAATVLAVVGLAAPAARAQDAPAGVETVYVPEPTPALASLVPTGTDAAIVRVLWFALDAVGKPYAFGARGPDSFDCSGLVDAAYRAAGLRVGPTTEQQQTVGTAVASVADLAPGDLVFVPGADGTAQDPGHVGLYLGNGLIVQATHTGDVVRITPLSAWSASIAVIRRVVPAPAPPIAPARVPVGGTRT